MIRPILFAAGLILALAAPSMASVQTVSAGDMIKLRYNGVGYRTGSVGEFQVRDSANNPLFHTFCAEESEYIYDNEIVRVDATSLTTASSNRPLTFGAAKLYREYFDGIAANNYGFGSGLSNITIGGLTYRLGGTDAQRAADGSALQQALWAQLGWIANPLSTLTGNALAWYNYAQTINNDLNLQDPNYWDVRILNLTAAGAGRQDQFGVVPEASTVVIWSALGLIGYAGRRLHSSKQAA